MREIHEWLPIYIIAVIVAAVATASFVVRRTLAPVRLAATKAAQIDINSLDQRVPTGMLPEEITPLVDAINVTLTRLEASIDRQRRFTANAAHELRTPLAIMRSRLDNAKPTLLRADLLGDASKLQSIIDEILIASRLSAGQLQLVQAVDINATVERALGSLMKIAMNRNRCIDFVSSSTGALTDGNERAIECVVTNLVDNALRAEPEHGLVEVRVDGATVYVIDHGNGVAAEDRERIFEPFWRKSDSTPGAGLGLAMAREIMDAHGGRIWVADTPGGGATFILNFKDCRGNATAC